MSEEQGFDNENEKERSAWYPFNSKGCLISIGIFCIAFFVGCMVCVSNIDTSDTDKKMDDFIECREFFRSQGQDTMACDQIMTVD
ncbi:MAG: hypothetical protein F4X65_09800 [Chloroflexi bacterium]|nr:hypothetical protein [Chloroflexota bacterium]